MKDTFAYINGKLEVDCIDKYRNCFPINDQGRIFRYLQFNKKLGLHGTDKPIGENVLRNCGKEIANYLNLENPNKYTGQCWRGRFFF